MAEGRALATLVRPGCYLFGEVACLFFLFFSFFLFDVLITAHCCLYISLYVCVLSIHSLSCVSVTTRMVSMPSCTAKTWR